MPALDIAWPEKAAPFRRKVGLRTEGTFLKTILASTAVS
jgi:hypothetical protein